MKVQYSFKKMEKEIVSLKSINALELAEFNIKTCIERIKNSNNDSNDLVSLFDILGTDYYIYAGETYILTENIADSMNYLYLYVISKIRALKLYNNGLIVKNDAISYKYSNNIILPQLLYGAICTDMFEVFRPYGKGIDFETLQSIIDGDIQKANGLIKQFPDTATMYEKHKSTTSYYFEYQFMKDLFNSLITKNEKEFNDAILNRIEYLRKGHIMPIDIVSLAMISIARQIGIEFHLNLIEIPTEMLEYTIDKNNCILPLKF